MRRFLLCYLMCFYYPLLGMADREPIRELSLQEAIYLAVRQNPNVQQAQLNHVRQKYALDREHWQFSPHYGLELTRTTNRTYSVTRGGMVTANSTGFEPSATLLTPFGTSIKAASTNNAEANFHPGLSLAIMQPLMRGFGRSIVEANLYNAMDTEYISRLSVEGALRTTVTSVIDAYLGVISIQTGLKIDEEALVQAKKSVKDTQLFIKAGHKPGVELVAAQATVASAEGKIENDKNNLQQAKYNLLQAIGINPNTPVVFKDVYVPALIKRYPIPTLERSKQQALMNDIQYQIDQITFQGITKRALKTAEDNTRWQLNLSLAGSVGQGTGGGQNAGINSLVNGVNTTNTAILKLTIPIDDRAAKQTVAIAKIAIREAEIALQQEKWNKETLIINAWHNVYSAERALHFAENTERLQFKTYEISNQKYAHGLIDSLELQTAHQQAVSSQQGLSDARISYLKALVALDQLMGNTLTTWDVKIRLS